MPGPHLRVIIAAGSGHGRRISRRTGICAR
jgi:hypothetical protein